MAAADDRRFLVVTVLDGDARDVARSVAVQSIRVTMPNAETMPSTITRLRGVIAAIATPIDEHLEPNTDALVFHARWLLANGCDGLNVLGTTGGFASFSVAQRIRVMEAVATSGLPRTAMMVGTGGAAFADTVMLTTRALELGFAGALVIPPFYYKNVTEDGVFAHVANLIERVASSELRLYLYHFPAMSGVAFTPQLVGRLIGAYPQTIVGLKDSSNDAGYVAGLHREFPEFDVFPSSESVLTTARREGYAGCISASVNVTAPLAGRVWNAIADAESEQAELARIRDAIGSVPLVPAVHHLVGRLHGDSRWARLMPPLHALTRNERTALESSLGETSFSDAMNAPAQRG